MFLEIFFSIPTLSTGASQSNSLLGCWAGRSGLGSGDRREEFAAFGADPKNHKEVYRSHWAQLTAALERPPRIVPSPNPAAAFELRPAAATDIPLLAVGSGGQTLEWIARNAAGWATYHRPPRVQRDRHMLLAPRGRPSRPRPLQKLYRRSWQALQISFSRVYRETHRSSHDVRSLIKANRLPASGGSLDRTKSPGASLPKMGIFAHWAGDFRRFGASEQGNWKLETGG